MAKEIAQNTTEFHLVRSEETSILLKECLTDFFIRTHFPLLSR